MTTALWLLRRLLSVVITLAVLAFCAALVFGALVTARGWPQVTGTVTLPALHAPVTVVRDASGIIHITAEDPRDLFVAQGYAHAQERMWQMEISRRIGAGRLAELFGKSEIDTDRYIRTLGWRAAAQRDLDAMDPEVVALLDAYAEGVNAWIAQHNGDLSASFVVTGLLSGTGGLGGFTLEPWTPLDTATWQKVQAWALGNNLDAEIFRMLADAKLGDPALTDELFPQYDGPVITPTGLEGSGGAGAAAQNPGGGGTPAVTPAAAPASLTDDHEAALAGLAVRGAAIASLAGFDAGGGLLGDHGVGSNNWVVAGDRTRSGKPLLANDPHLGFALPSVWIMNGLHCRTVGPACPWDVAGASFPGAPAVILGHNARIAWGATNVGPDTQDLFRETVDPKNPGQYLFRGASVPFEIRHEVIKVAGGADVELDVRSTGHGAVLSEVDDRLKDGPVLALRWTTTAEPDRALEAFVRVNLASNFEEFLAAFEAYGSPSQNFIYADVDGHIGYVLPGLVPIRGYPGCNDPGLRCALPQAPPAPGRRVRDGSSGDFEWLGYVPRDQLPFQLDPPSGLIVTANNAPVDDRYPYWLGAEWDPGWRAQRVTNLLEDIPAAMTADDLRVIQGDTYLLRADTIIPAIEALSPAPATPEGKLLLSRIQNWNRQCDTGSTGCAAYVVTELTLMRALFDDELGPLARDYVDSPMAWQGLISMLGRPGDDWWDDTTTKPEVETATVTVTRAFDRAAADLGAALGDPATWTWDRLHRVRFRESTLGSSGIGPLEWYFDAEAIPVSGGNGAIVNNYYRLDRLYPNPNDESFKPVGLDRAFEVTNGPSLRLSIDMADVDGARIMITTGQSGNPFAGHYADLIPLWAANQTVALPFSASQIGAAAASTLTLQP